MAHIMKGRPQEGSRTSLYEEITRRIIADLESGRLPWVQPWHSGNAAIGLPHNVVSDRRYSGINVLTLWHAVVTRGFRGHGFLTFRQAVALGGSVRCGERGTAIVYSRRAGTTRTVREPHSESDKKGGFSFLKQFTVFSVDQCDGLPDRYCEPLPPIPKGLILPEAEALIAATGADVRIGGASAYYSPRHDFVAVPHPQDFYEPINWHRTTFHELGHWTGHDSRLGRDQTGNFGSKPYGQEELVAEMAGAFVCAALGIAPTVRHADYIGSWLAIIREDHRAILRAASAASKAADFLLAFRDRHSAAGDAAAAVDAGNVIVAHPCLSERRAAA